jgi:hypothetical protein
MKSASNVDVRTKLNVVIVATPYCSKTHPDMLGPT